MILMNRKVATLAAFPWNSQWKNFFVPALIGVLTAACIVQYQLTRYAVLDKQNAQVQPEAIYVEEEKIIGTNLTVAQKMPKFGFDSLIADWAFLNFMQYFGDEPARKATGYKAAPNFFKVIVNRDPLFLQMYPYLSSSISLFSGQPQQTVTLLEQGAKAIPPQLQPEAYFLWQAKGTDELLFLGRNSAAQASYEKAAEWASRSSDPQIQAIAERSRETARFLASNPDSRRARVAAWSNILTNAVDESTRQFAIRQIMVLGGNVSVKNGVLQVKLPKQD
jgi:hypothetical protein